MEIEGFNWSNSMSSLTRMQGQLSPNQGSKHLSSMLKSQANRQENVQDKGKGKMVEPKKPMKKKELIRLDEEIASKLQAEFDEEAKIEADHELAFKRVNTFVDFRTDLVEGSSKRAGEELEQRSSKKQKCAPDAIPLAVKSPSIVDWKIHKEGKKSYYQIIRADGSSKMYLVFSHMLKSFDKEDLETFILKKGRPFLSTARAKIDVYKRKITLRVGEERIVFTSVKPASSLIKRVYMLSLRERIELDLEARLMGETLVLNRSLDPFLEDYIELNDLNEPFELRRNQGDDLMPTIKECEVIEEFRTRDDQLNVGIDDYPSYCDYDKKIHIDCAHNLKFSCMIGFEFTHANFFPLLYVNVISKKFHNSIMKEKLEYKGNNVVEALMNIPIFVGTFSVMTDFAVLENMDAYRDEGMGDVIFGEPFLREVRIKEKMFKGIITIYNGDDEVTYQMVRSHPRFKRHTNEQCDKIPPLLKVSKEDKMNGISHPYQKLKGFYKGVLNLRPDYIRDAKMEEWLTRGYISQGPGGVEPREIERSWRVLVCGVRGVDANSWSDVRFESGMESGESGDNRGLWVRIAERLVASEKNIAAPEVVIVLSGGVYRGREVERVSNLAVV
ncbi:hypothetical protein Tco_1122041 [Tanacetum coccineum]|uniref:Uncharacterized protein n=1 Tax=Tanacetum coccineum TaxID=301880 RepID=A0ABQ5IZW0_9ASTR